MSVNDYRVEPTNDVFEVHYGPSVSCATFIFGNEEHTLGNTLRYVLMEQVETDFCGYSVPHPYEPKMNVRLQTKAVPGSKNSAPSSISVLKNGLKDMSVLCDMLDTEFDSALTKFKNMNK